jgi:hypothetical protein
VGRQPWYPGTGTPTLTPNTVTVELRRVPTSDVPADGLGVVLGHLEPDRHGCLAALHRA